MSDGVSASTSYLADALVLDRPLSIVDVGANPVGETPIYDALIDGGLAELWGFEPNAEAFAKLSAGRGRHYLPVAIGAPGPATFRAHAISDLSSLYRFRSAAARYLGRPQWLRREVTEHEIDLVTLDSLSEISTIDFLKMDVQGAELDVARGGLSKLSTAAAVVAEVSFYQMYEDQPMFSDIDAELRRQGFVLHRFLFQKATVLPSSQSHRLKKWKARSQLMDADAVYVRSMDDPGCVPSETLKALALLADAIFRSPDLTLMCLDELIARGAVEAGTAAGFADRISAELRVAEEPAGGAI